MGNRLIIGAVLVVGLGTGAFFYIRKLSRHRGPVAGQWTKAAPVPGTTASAPADKDKPNESHDENVNAVPPAGIAPFDPKPLMEKLKLRITTDKFRFAVFGDAKHAPTLPAFIKYMDETVKPDFCLTTGDMVRSGSGKVGPGYYQMLGNEAGQDMRKRAWWPAIGNHELAGQPVTGKEAGLSDEDIIRKNQAAGIANFKSFYNLENDYYSFSFRNCCFIALPFHHPVGTQVAWLEAELKKASEAKQHIFVFNHAPFFTVGSKSAKDVANEENALTALLQKYHVRAVFSGHDHGYYRTIRSGVPYIVSAGGGATLYEGKRTNEALPGDVWYYRAAGGGEHFVRHNADGSEVKTDEPDQFMSYVDVDGDKLTCVCVTAKGEKWDEFTLGK